MKKLWLLILSLILCGSAESLTRAEVGSFRLRPLGIMSSIYGGEVELYGGSRLSFGPTVQYFDLYDSLRSTSTRGWELGLRATVLIGPLENGRTAWYGGAALNFYPLRASAVGTAGTEGSLEFSTWGGQWVVGRQWDARILGEIWNIRLGAGMGYLAAFRRPVLIDGAVRNLGITRHLDPLLEFTLAYQF